MRLAQKLPRLRTDRLVSGIAVGGTLLFLCGVGAGAWLTLDRIESAVREAVRRNLTTSLATAREAARHWATRQQAVAATLAASQGVTEGTARLLGGTGRARVQVSAAQAAIARSLEEPVRTGGLGGYWILDTGEQVVERVPATLPATLPKDAGSMIARGLDGLPGIAVFGDDRATSRLAAYAPIRGPSGAPIALLVLALPAERELTRIADQGQLRSHGRTLFFDGRGNLIAASTHEGVPRDGQLRDPVTGAPTPMVAAASTGRAGLNLTGYTDHRGRQVVGAWAWDEQLGMGIASESDVRDAYHVVETARSGLVAACIITVLLFLAVIASLVQGRRRAVVLSAMQRRLAAVLESTTDPVCFAGADGTAIYVNDAGRALIGGREQHLNQPGTPPPSWARLLLAEEPLAAAARNGTWSGETTILTADAREVTLSQVIICHRTEQGEVEFYSTVARDITERKQFERHLAMEKERAEVTLGSIGDAVLRTDAGGRIEYVNLVAEELLGRPASELLGQPSGAVLTLVHETTREPLENPVDVCLREGRVVGRTGLSLLLRADGRELSIDDSVSPVVSHDGEVMGTVVVFHDVSRARTLARQLAHQASHDFLTGLTNRHEFERRVGRALTRAQQDGVCHALCFLDLDQFKVVNDTCGHTAGDELLRQLAGVLQKKVRRRDTLARLGGDEFGVLLENCPPQQATRVVADLLETVQEFRFVWEGKPFALGVSIGVVPVSPQSESLGAVLRDADAACYAAKERGRNRVHFYEPNDAVMAHRQGEMQWVSRVTSALEERRFRLYGQAIVPLVPEEGERMRVEVLLRMVERDGTIVAPGAFIPAAERYGLMGAVDRWVVREVVEMYARHRHFRRRPIASINLSGASLGDPGMLAYVREQLARYNLPPETLCFEITETAAIANLATAAAFIRELKALGCWFALDDFGSGMSSFGYLQSLPVDALKIAGAFLRHIETDPVEHAMVEAIHRVGHVMNLKTVAEGVESLETLETLRRIGVDYAQGFAIAVPEPLEPLLVGGIRPLNEEGGRLRPASLQILPRTRPASA